MINSINLLVVDDNEMDHLIYSEYLSKGCDSFNISYALTADEGIATCFSYSPDCILLDYNLPGKNGLEFIKEAQCKKELKQIPIIMLTGEGAEQVAVTALKSGAKDYIIKDELSPAVLEKTIRSVINSKKLEAKIQKQHDKIKSLAYHDSLTSLLNRHSFYKILEGCLSTAQRNNHLLAVLFIDLDNFKYVNDTYGHQIGDILLKQVTEKITKHLRKGEIISRFGGDEFVIGLPDIRDPKFAASVAKKLLNAICGDYQIGDLKFYIGASIGISIFPNNGHDINELVKCADQSMYAAKKKDGNAFCFFTRQLQEDVNSRVQMENILRENLKYKRNIYLDYQPQYCAQTGKVISFEALLRCHDEKIGLIHPEKIISIAQDIGLQNVLGDQIIEIALKDYRNCISKLSNKPRISINASPNEIGHPKYFNRFINALNAYSVDPKEVEIEITECSVIDTDMVYSTIDLLRKSGVRISLDDFGTGYSSLAQLRDILPLNSIKIDKMFVRDMEINLRNYQVTKSIIGIAENFQLDVIAEGIEKECHIKELRKLGCTYLQGFYLNKPMSPYDISKHFH